MGIEKNLIKYIKKEKSYVKIEKYKKNAK